MNAVMDLTARAVSFITAIQTTLLRGTIENGKEKISILTIPPEAFKERLYSFCLKESSLGKKKKTEQINFETRAMELIWVTRKPINVPAATSYALHLSAALVTWIWNNKENGISAMSQSTGGYPTPFKWRQVISEILYKHPGERVEIAKALQYLPIHVVLALGAGHEDARTQRIAQMWRVSDDDKKYLLNDQEITNLQSFEKSSKGKRDYAEVLLKNEDLLFRCTRRNNVPFPFEYVFRSELREICKNRVRRNHEQAITSIQGPKELLDEDRSPISDPFEKGKEMGLYALAFSGGGIRSATFNLGILQGLAKRNVLDKFDYLSTVSGGGYIGSWLAVWIKREGSLVKVSNRLNPNKSPDPLGEELRPIKWLRMFSNYFTPNASIMSVDSWTVGITWLRNTLLNQVIIFLLLLSLLFTGNLLYSLWIENITWTNDSWQYVTISSIILLIPVSLLAGLGMHAYHSEKFHLFTDIRREQTKVISKWIMFIGLFGAYLTSAWIFSRSHPTDLSQTAGQHYAAYNKIIILFPGAITVFVALSVVAILGKYVNCVKDSGAGSLKSWVIVFGTAAIAAVIGLISLTAAWSLLEFIENHPNTYVKPWKRELQFIIGLPLALEVFSITVVARMALLGKYFPDERREWWGRMGAYVHRISFLWILVAASALLGKEFIKVIFTEWYTGLAATGGWIALVGSTVKAAFSSDSSGKDEKKSAKGKFFHLLGLMGPYLFALGLLIFLPGLIDPLLSLLGINHYFFPEEVDKLAIFLIIVFSGFAAYLLAGQVGVNEFSMHHFYRNRLVRAFLGATRRSTDRQRSYNPFTGFDMQDDEKLCRLTNDNGYYGPYPVLNTALNASHAIELDRQDRKAESFIFSPLFCGFDFSMSKAAIDLNEKSYDYAYRETDNYAYKDGPSIGTALAISGAAVNPNQGYHSSAATAFLLTVFNVQMGWWIGNPRKNTWKCSDPEFGLGYIMNNLLGKTSTRNEFISLSDGGHFDNMGLYEMVRRKCRFIILCDAEQDDKFTCEGFANAIRRCRIDFGAEICIDLSKIVDRTDNRFSESHHALGTIKYAGDAEPSGRLLYIKSSITTDLPVDVFEYAIKNETFPHQTTADQFFNEEQFESYRKLGLHIGDKVFGDDAILKELWMPTTKDG